MAWLLGWTNRKKLTISNLNVLVNLAWYPLFFKFMGDADIGAVALANGNDIRFTESDGTTLLEYDEIYFGIAAGIAVGVYRISKAGWVLSSVAPTEIYIYYGNPMAAAGKNGPLVYDGFTGAFWHLHEGAAPYRDATINANHSSANALNTQVNGQLYKAQRFFADGAYIGVPITPSFNLGVSDYTCSQWIQIEDYAPHDAYHGRCWDGVGGWVSFSHGAGSTTCVTAMYVWATTGVTGPVAGAWGRWVVRCDRDNPLGLECWLDMGISGKVDPTGVPDITSSGAFAIGNTSTLGSVAQIMGSCEAFRISKTWRSDAWLQFEYYNEATVGNQITPGPEEDFPVVPTGGAGRAGKLRRYINLGAFGR